MNEINSAEAGVTRYPAGRVKGRGERRSSWKCRSGGQARQWPVVISTFSQRSSVSHGDSAQTPWLLCKLKYHSVKKPVGSLKGWLEITVAISKMTGKEKFLAIHFQILC